MGNKFLELYSALWEPRIGDKVRIIKVLDSNKKPTSFWYYKIGDCGIVNDDANIHYRAVEVKFHNGIYGVYFDEMTLL